MKKMKLKLSIFCIVVCGLVGLMASPAAAVTVISQSANTDIYLGLPFNDLEFENPLAGTETVKEYAIKEWRDADYASGSPPWYDDWTVSDPAGIDGNVNEIWMRRRDHSISTTTTVASTVVSIHLVGDNNDGLAEVFVDGVQVAKLDMYTPSPPSQTALIIVKNLANTPHTITVKDMGLNPGNPLGADDVATMGAAALEKRIKWSQPPIPTEPDNLYYGWNEPSHYNGHHIVADDWVCQTNDPVTDIHWWGSYQGWKVGTEPLVIPSSFHITIWTDVPDTDPGDPDTFSHPGRVIWETDCTNFTSKFVGWDYDPRTGCYEACFYFEQFLTEAEYFYQHTNPDGTPNIYWISIAAEYPTTVDVEHPWGWKTRPHDSTMAPDDAVRIFDPTAPHINDPYITGKPIEYPPGKSWDMAFELTAKTTTTVVKWTQTPDLSDFGLDVDGTKSDDSVQFPPQILADDFRCELTGPITEIVVWSSWWRDEMPEGDPTNLKFTLSLHKDIPANQSPTGYSMPGEVVWIKDFQPGDFTADIFAQHLYEGWYSPCTQIYEPHGDSICWIYRFPIDPRDAYVQEEGFVYWLDVQAQPLAPDPMIRWGWKSSMDHWNDDAVWIVGEEPYHGDWNELRYPEGHPLYRESIDLAFEITTTDEGDMYVKWQQPPEPYTPPAYEGWNELSVYNWEQIAADDWFCDTDSPVTDIHWWGSYIGWSCEDEPPVVPDSFHIAIWTDVPSTPGTSDFSHPGKVIWETVCKDFTREFVGWDIDPRNPYAPPETCFKFEQDLLEKDWFKQKPGGNIYWLSIAARYPAGSEVEYPWGWKTRRRDPKSLAPDDAVIIWGPTAPVLGSAYNSGGPIWWPTWDDSWDLAFELTTKEIPPKEPVPHLKWSQPPIEVNPDSRIPVYSGWDEVSIREIIPSGEIWFDCWNCRTQCHGDADCDGDVDDDDRLILMAARDTVYGDPGYDPCADFNRDLAVNRADMEIYTLNFGTPIDPNCPTQPLSEYWRIVADDYRCLGSMPVTSMHWWGSYFGYVEPGTTPPVLPIGWKIGFWTNVPAHLDWIPGDRHKMHYPQLPDPNGWDIDITWANMSADDWECTESGYVTDIHFWYSWLRDQVGLIDRIRVEIYDDLSATDPANPYGYSVPRNVQWEREFLLGQFSTRLWGQGDQGFMMPAGNWQRPDHKNIYQCNIVDIPQPFYQEQGKIYWLALSISIRDPLNTHIGWKTSRSKQFMDDAVYQAATVPWAPWTDPITGNSLDLAFVITGDVHYSHPERMLWQIKVPTERVEVEEVGTDFYHDFYPEDIAYQYTLYLEPDEVFWQADFLDDTKDDIFWLSIAAIYSPDIADIPYPWGWKTRPWSWMDDAVRFTYDGPLEPGIALHPIDITPIKDPLYNESFDVAFELDTDPNYIKAEQPFTGIRRWPHYEDEKSMATEVTTTEVVTKWSQKPDLTEMGVDVDATWSGPDSPYLPQLLADDFNCVTTEPITGIHIYGSWWHDRLPTDVTGMENAAQVQFTLSFHEDIPPSQSPTGYSMPGDELWTWQFGPGEFTVEMLPEEVPESYYMPCTGIFTQRDHRMVWKYSFNIDPARAFLQEGSPDNPVIYWLDVQAQPLDVMQDPEVRFGWKTSIEHWNDDAVWRTEHMPISRPWEELRYPPEHPYAEKSMDLAFELTTDRVTTEFITDHLVADDWKCKRKTPVTAAVWWGSYIGYEFKPCHGEFMPLPVKPDYFLLNIWTDVPANAASTVPFSHPNEIIWEYKAYDYDEVLVGYDKHPEGINVAICGAPSDPSWNNDVQAKLLATGQFNSVDIITVNTITPTLAQLQAYNSVLVYSDAIYADANALGNVMADYVDAGGGVVCAMFEIGYGSGPNPHDTAQMKGRWLAQGYYVIPRTAQYGPPQATLGTVYVPTHPIMQGVSTFDGGTTSARPIWTTVIPPGATRVADWSDGAPLVVTKTIAGVPRADLGLYPPSSDSRSDFWVSSTDGALLMANALSWVASSGPTVSRRREPVFRYSVRLPRKDWFFQEDINDIYWLSVVAVYESGTDPLYDWGWTNHKHVFNDDAVAGSYDPAADVWSWIDLYDQLGNSEDMSFILFTDPNECFCCPDYNSDGIINFLDYANFADDWFWSGPPGGYNHSDLNCDGIVDFYDLDILTQLWLSGCP